MTDHIPVLIEASCSGKLHGDLEALTVLENLEGPFNEDDLFKQIHYFSNNFMN